MLPISNLVGFTTWFCRVLINPKYQFGENFFIYSWILSPPNWPIDITIIPPKAYTEEDVVNTLFNILDNSVSLNKVA